MCIRYKTNPSIAKKRTDIIFIILFCDFSFCKKSGITNIESLSCCLFLAASIAHIFTSCQFSSLKICSLDVYKRQQKIPRDLYEAAEMDGAGKIRQFFSITVPQVKQMFFVTMVITVVGAFTVFNEPYILTGGGPGTSTMTLALHMYQTGVVKNDMGYASTIAILIFIITAVLSSIQFFTIGGKEE